MVLAAPPAGQLEMLIQKRKKMLKTLCLDGVVFGDFLVLGVLICGLKDSLRLLQSGRLQQEIKMGGTKAGSE